MRRKVKQVPNEYDGYDTCEINGYNYFVSELTTEEFIRQNDLRDFEGLQVNETCNS